MQRKSADLQTKNLASIFRGLYFRVATRLGVDPSYVSRVARGERKSEAVEAALESETRKIVSQFATKLKRNHTGVRRNSANRDGSRGNVANRRGAKVSRFTQN